MDGSTIAALATAPAPAGVAVVRVSGPRTRTALAALFRGKKDPLAHPRLMCFGDILDFKSGEAIDKGLAVFMPGPASFTGEDVAEFQFHGSPVLVQRVLRSLYAFGILPAPAGEFTKRAFLGGKLDLAQAEAIADVVNSKTEEELRFAGELRLDFDRRTEGRPQLVQRDDVEDFRRRDAELALLAVVRNRQQPVAARKILRNELQGFRIGDDLREIDRFLADRSRHDVANRGFGDEPEPHQLATDRNVVLLLLGERDAELIGRDQSLLNEQFA